MIQDHHDHIEPDNRVERVEPAAALTAAEAAARAAEMAATAARAAERAETAARFAERLAHIGSAVTRELALPGLVDLVLDEVVQTLGARLAMVYRADVDRRRLELVGQRNLPDDLVGKVSDVSFDAPLLAARVASARQSRILSSLDQLDPDLMLTREQVMRAACRSVVSLPLVVRGRLIGVLTFAMERDHEFSSDERAALQNCADIFAFAIANAIAYEEERRLHALFEAVHNASRAIASEFELQPTLQNIVDEARAIVDAEYAALGIVISEDRPFSPWVFSGMTREQEAAMGRHPRPVGVLGRVALQGETVRVPDVRRCPESRGLPDGHPAINSFLGIPIHHGGRMVGNLYLANKRGAHEFSLEDQRAVELLAAHAGAAVHHSQLREQLDFERTRFRAIVENAPGGVHFVEAGTEKITANRRALELVGQASVATVADYTGELCTVDGKPLPRDEWPSRRVLRGEAFTTQEMLLRTPDHREISVLVSAAPVMSRDGRMEGVIVVFEDIWILKHLQRLREEWAAMITHDLRQPLSVIMTQVSLLEAMVENVDRQVLVKALQRTLKASETLNQMISELTDASRVETERFELKRELIEIDALVREVVERQRSIARDRVINLQVSGPSMKVEADPVRIEQVLGNLLVNALKYSQPGTEIEVEVGRVDGEALVRVKNRGPGISAEDLPKIFGHYFRTGRARAGAVPGLGLGLYIAKGLIDAHSGRIWAESRPGETTTFQFTLPIARDVVPQ